MKKVLLLLLTLAVHTAFAQYSGRNVDRDPSASIIELGNTITAQELRRHLAILSSDEFEGRETGQPGQKLAAEYIAGYFAELGLPTIGEDYSYFQKISFISEGWENIDLHINGENPKHLWDYYALPATNSDQERLQVSEITFLGYGIDDQRYSDYKGVDVKDKVILIYDGEPFGKDSISQVTGTAGASDWSKDFRKKLTLAKEKGVKAVLIIDTNFKQNLRNTRRFILNSGLNMGWGENAADNYANNYFISSALAKMIVGENFKKVVKARKKMQQKGRSKSINLSANLEMEQHKKVRQLIGENVMGYIEGTDPQLKDELVIISAHYDHIGTRGDEVFNGADDNGSGTSTLLEVCQAFVDAKKNGVGPRRSVLVMLVSGEEKGLLGSKYYVEHPVFPLENTVANVNVDMVGRVDKKHADNPNYIYVIGSNRLSTDLHRINEGANARYTQLELDYTYNAEDDPNRYYYRSDHYNFAEKGIPAIFYFNGTHEDYHRPSDTIEKINFEKMETIARLVFFTSWELSNRDERIKVDVLKK
ncbi:MAG: hypothetical protein DHS20C18_48130 [Saprospiraceae bacterium]|nr:MAG: hypothetical protein DHS20C18_48130 [Saprospiraceae bacterium]